MLIPLDLYPPFLRRLTAVLPFRGTAYVPLSIYDGRIPASAVPASIAVQSAWASGLIILGRLVWLRAIRNLTIQGG